MLENVPALAIDERFRQLERQLVELGYHIESRVVDAARYGVPQRRKRLILLAARGRAVSFPAAQLAGKTVREALAGLGPAGSSGDALHDLPERRSDRIRELIRLIPKDGGSRSALPMHARLNCHSRCSGFKDVYGRMAWDDVAPTITSGCFNPSKGRFLHPSEDRAITLREAAVLQGFPVDYDFGEDLSKQGTALLIGNALPPPLICAHARALMSSLKKGADSCQTVASPKLRS
jgi:DNA (cytosine-5)-methyltransferase 1